MMMMTRQSPGVDGVVGSGGGSVVATVVVGGIVVPEQQ